MNNPLLIGITGGIGAGKSIVSKIFKVLNIPVYDADTEAKLLMVTHQGIKEKVIELFGTDSYLDGSLNRKHISSLAFHNPDLLQKLNAVVHPAVGSHFDAWSKSHQQVPYLLKEAALIFEAGTYKSLDLVINVSCPKEIRLKRTLERDTHRKESDVLAIMEKQFSDEERKERSDFEILNDEVNMVIPQVLSIHQTLINKSQQVI